MPSLADDEQDANRSDHEVHLQPSDWPRLKLHYGWWWRGLGKRALSPAVGGSAHWLCISGGWFGVLAKIVNVYTSYSGRSSVVTYSTQVGKVVLYPILSIRSKQKQPECRELGVIQPHQGTPRGKQKWWEALFWHAKVFTEGRCHTPRLEGVGAERVLDLGGNHTHSPPAPPPPALISCLTHPGARGQRARRQSCLLQTPGAWHLTCSTLHRRHCEMTTVIPVLRPRKQNEVS